MKSCVLQDHYDDEHDEIILNNTAPDLQDQDQDHNVQDQEQDQDNSMQDQDQFFWSQTGLVLRPMVSDHTTAKQCQSSEETRSGNGGE